MEFFDTHFHFYNDMTPAQYVAQFGTEYDFRLMAAGAEEKEWAWGREFAEKVDNSIFAVGIHPHGAGEFDFINNTLAEYRHHPKLKAVGEIGLDYFYENADPERQKKVLDYFLKLALEWNLPVIIHCRDLDGVYRAYEDIYPRLRDFATSGGNFVCHCFAGNRQWAEKFIELGAYLGVTGIVTFPKGGNIRELLPLIPADKLLLETDAPYLAPAPYRGKINHPGYLPIIGAKVAEVLGKSLEEVARETTANGRRLYRWE